MALSHTAGCTGAAVPLLSRASIAPRTSPLAAGRRTACVTGHPSCARAPDTLKLFTQPTISTQATLAMYQEPQRKEHHNTGSSWNDRATSDTVSVGHIRAPRMPRSTRERGSWSVTRRKHYNERRVVSHAAGGGSSALHPDLCRQSALRRPPRTQRTAGGSESRDRHEDGSPADAGVAALMAGWRES